MNSISVFVTPEQMGVYLPSALLTGVLLGLVLGVFARVQKA